MLQSVLTIGFACVAAVWAENTELPAGTVTCRIDSPDRDECIKDLMQGLTPQLHDGIASLNIPPIDPLVLQRSHFEYKRGPMHVLMTVKTATIFGLSRTQFRTVRTEMSDDGMVAEIESYQPRVLIEGAYKAEGEFQGAKMNARGNFNVTFKHVTSHVKMSGVFEEHDGERYLQIKAFDAVLDMDNMKIQANGIFPEPELNKLVLDFINQNWPSIYRVMIPETKEIWEPRMIEEMNAFLMRIPFRVFLH